MEDGRRISDESLFDFETKTIPVDEDYLGSPTVKKVPLRQYRRRKSFSYVHPSTPPPKAFYGGGAQNRSFPQRKHIRHSSIQLDQPPPLCSKNPYRREGHRRSQSQTFEQQPRCQSGNLDNVNIRPFQDDFIVEKAKETFVKHQTDYEKLLKVCEQMATAQRLADVATQLMAETLRGLNCNSKLKKQTSELADLVREQNRVNTSRTDLWQHSLLDALDNIKSSHQETTFSLQEKYDDVKKKYDDFHEKHPDYANCDGGASAATNSSDSTDDESVNSSRNNSSSLYSMKSGIMSMFNREKEKPLADRSQEKKEQVLLHRNDFLNAVDKFKKKSTKLLSDELNQLIKLYSPHGLSPYQPTQNL